MTTQFIRKCWIPAVAAVLCVPTVLTTVQIDTASKQATFTVGEPAHARRRMSGAVMEVLSFVGENVLESVIEEGVGRAFDAASAHLRASTQSSDTYVGSYFVEPYSGTHFMASPQHGWYVFNAHTWQWQSTYQPNTMLYRLNDIYQTPSGHYRSVSTR